MACKLDHASTDLNKAQYEVVFQLIKESETVQSVEKKKYTQSLEVGKENVGENKINKNRQIKSK